MFGGHFPKRMVSEPVKLSLGRAGRQEVSRNSLAPSMGCTLTSMSALPTASPSERASRQTQPPGDRAGPASVSAAQWPSGCWSSAEARRRVASVGLPSAGTLEGTCWGPGSARLGHLHPCPPCPSHAQLALHFQLVPFLESVHRASGDGPGMAAGSSASASPPPREVHLLAWPTRGAVTLSPAQTRRGQRWGRGLSPRRPWGWAEQLVSTLGAAAASRDPLGDSRS